MYFHAYTQKYKRTILKEGSIYVQFKKIVLEEMNYITYSKNSCAEEVDIFIGKDWFRRCSKVVQLSLFQLLLQLSQGTSELNDENR